MSHLAILVMSCAMHEMELEKIIKRLIYRYFVSIRILTTDEQIFNGGFGIPSVPL